MRTLPRALLALVGLALAAGCESVSREWRDRREGAPMKVHEVDGERRTVYHAAQAAVRRIGFVLQRSSISEGLVVGQSAIQPGDPTRSARQYRLEVRLVEIDANRVEVGLLLIEQAEGGVLRGAEKRLREHGLYESYFEALQAVLADPGLRAER
jgi:hypothetical protein